MSVGNVGTVLPGGRYKLLQPLGAGAFGEVWRASDLHRGQEVALKFLLRTPHGEAWREATMLTSLDSPFMLKVNNADLIGDVPFIDTKLAAGSLDRYVDGGGMEPHRAVEAIRRILRGLQTCHAVGLLHRDVKPANLFEDVNGDILLGDFGVAELLDAEGFAPLHGDMRIVAPEGLRTGRLTTKSDIYSAAVTLFALLSGQWPWGRLGGDELKAMIASGSGASLRDVAPHVSRGLSSVVQTAMSLEPESRYDDVGTFDDALGRLPSRSNRITPLPAHEGHARCWGITGQRDLRVCTFDDEQDRVITVRHDPSGRSVRGFEDARVSVKRLPVELRLLFDRIR